MRAACSGVPQLVHAVVSGVAMVLFVGIALLMHMAEVETNPTSRRPSALGHSGADVMAFVIKVGIACSAYTRAKALASASAHQHTLVSAKQCCCSVLLFLSEQVLGLPERPFVAWFLPLGALCGFP